MSDTNRNEASPNPDHPTGQQPAQDNAQNKAAQSGGKQQPDIQGHAGAHNAEGNEKVESRSADPGQSSYGGFKGENPAGQAIDDKKADKSS